MPALTGLENLCSIRLSSVAKNSTALCPVRPPQTAFGWVFADGHHGARPPIGSSLGSAPGDGRCNVAKPSGIGLTNALCRLDIAAAGGGHPPPAIVQSAARDKSSCGRPPHFLPSLAGLFHLIDARPSHEWLGYCHCVAPRPPTANCPNRPSQTEYRKRAVQVRNAPVFAPVFTALRRGELLRRGKECGVRPNLISVIAKHRAPSHTPPLLLRHSECGFGVRGHVRALIRRDMSRRGKAMPCHRTPQISSRQGQPEISPAHRAGIQRPKQNPS